MLMSISILMSITIYYCSQTLNISIFTMTWSLNKKKDHDLLKLLQITAVDKFIISLGTCCSSNHKSLFLEYSAKANMRSLKKKICWTHLNSLFTITFPNCVSQRHLGFVKWKQTCLSYYKS